MTLSMKDQIKSILQKTFRIHSLEVLDDSDLHAGHSGAIESGGGHFRVIIVSADFEGKPLIQRHRMVYDALKPVIHDIHALAISAKTP